MGLNTSAKTYNTKVFLGYYIGGVIYIRKGNLSKDLIIKVKC